MRSLLFAAFLCIISWNADSQITLMAGAVPGPGTSYKEYFGDSSIDPGPAGANQTWNFSFFLKVDSIVNNYIACSSTPWCSTFPGATTAVNSGSEFYHYYTLTSTFLANRGYFDTLTGETAIYDNAKDVMRFPFTYNSSYVDTWASTTTSFGITYKSSGHDSVKADGWGKLILPNGVYNNALRVRTITHTLDSAGVGSGGVTPLGASRSESYAWYVLNKAPVLITSTTTFTPTSGSPFTGGSSLYTSQSPTGLREPGMPELSVKVFPNPAHELLQLNFNNDEPIDLRIVLTDMVGRTIIGFPAAAYPAGTHLVKLNTSQLARGVYFLCLNAGSGIVSRKVEIN